MILPSLLSTAGSIVPIPSLPILMSRSGEIKSGIKPYTVCNWRGPSFLGRVWTAHCLLTVGPSCARSGLQDEAGSVMLVGVSLRDRELSPAEPFRGFCGRTREWKSVVGDCDKPCALQKTEGKFFFIQNLRFLRTLIYYSRCLPTAISSFNMPTLH